MSCKTMQISTEVAKTQNEDKNWNFEAPLPSFLPLLLSYHFNPERGTQKTGKQNARKEQKGFKAKKEQYQNSPAQRLAIAAM